MSLQLLIPYTLFLLSPTLYLLYEQRESRSRLDEEDRLNEEFTAMMVHELRAPLTAIKGTTDMVLTEDSLPQETREKLLASMREDAENMLKLVGNLLDLSKIKLGTFEVEPTAGDLLTTIKKEVAKFEAEAKQKGLEIETKLPNKLPKLTFDDFRIQQVLNNLISNAIKFTDEGKITVRAKKTNGQILVSVKDTGVGLSGKDLSELFSKFKQFAKVKTEKTDGTGLGLFISKNIVEEHGGRIWADSPGPGRGATFSFTLPV